MKSLLVVSAAAAALAAHPALAADLPVKAPVKAPLPIYNWSGFYIGANAGVSAGVTPIVQTTAFPPFPPDVVNTSTHDPFGAIGGLQAGYNLQSSNWVLGIEGDVQLSGQRSDPTCLSFCSFNFQSPANVQFDSVNQRIPWFATLRGRIGFTSGPLLFYGTAGGAFADIHTSFSTTNVVHLSAEASDQRAGLAVGGGIEAALTGNWTAKVEYLYLDYGVVTDNFTPPGFPSPLTVVSGRVVDHVARAGVNYRFGAPVPVATAGLMPTKARPITPAVYDWNGIYIGGNLGYSVGRDAAHEDIFGLFGNGSQRFMLVPRGAVGGAQVGYNYVPTPWLLLGVEADYQLADQRNTACFTWCIATSGSSTYSQSLDWFATARGRAGVVAGPALFYATAGGSWTKVSTTGTQVNTLTAGGVTTFFTSTGSFSDQRTGWAVGGGIEGAIGAGWTAKVEYLYLDFGTITNLFPSTGFNLADPNVHISTNIRDNVFRGGLNYHFLPWDVVKAKY